LTPTIVKIRIASGAYDQPRTVGGGGGAALQTRRFQIPLISNLSKRYGSQTAEKCQTPSVKHRVFDTFNVNTSAAAQRRRAHNLHMKMWYTVGV